MLPPYAIDHDQSILDDLKGQAAERAARFGHRLEPFRTAKHDPDCYVSFCADCRQMVIVNIERHGADENGALYGYALEAQCAAHGVVHRASAAVAVTD